MTKIEIKNTFTNELLFVFYKENNSIKDTVIEAVKNGIKLDFADLRDADLSGANLSGVNLSDAALQGANLRGVDLSGAIINKTEKSYETEYLKINEKHIEDVSNDDWEGDEEIFVPQDECSKPFNTPKILGCADNLDNDIVDGPFTEKKYNVWKIEGYVGNNDYDNPNDYNIHKEIIADNFFTKEDIIETFCKKYKKYRTVVVGKCEIIHTI